jgi:uncharacterized protein (DUF924 family)
MHSESTLVRSQALALFAPPSMESTLRFEQNQAIIESFGRFHHRKAILGRESTPERPGFSE